MSVLSNLALGIQNLFDTSSSVMAKMASNPGTEPVLDTGQPMSLAGMMLAVGAFTLFVLAQRR